MLLMLPLLLLLILCGPMVAAAAAADSVQSNGCGLKGSVHHQTHGQASVTNPVIQYKPWVLTAVHAAAAQVTRMLAGSLGRLLAHTSSGLMVRCPRMCITCVWCEALL